jgi:Mn-dependent DtxR family transcriptional regulator
MNLTSVQSQTLISVKNQIEAHGYARVTDVAKELDCSKATVTMQLKRLDGLGLVRAEKYMGIVLTLKGVKEASEVLKRLKTAESFLKSLKVSEKSIKADRWTLICDMSEDFLSRI